MKAKSIILVLAALFFYGCSNSDDEVKQRIILNYKEVCLWEGETATVEIESNLKQPSFKVEDEEVAKVELLDNIIKITTLKPGNAYIYISDPEYLETRLLVIVGSIGGSVGL